MNIENTFGVIYADPPWDYKGQSQHTGKNGKSSGGAVRHYPTMTLKELKALNVSQIASEDCLLFLWSSSPHLDQAVDLMRAWGFKYATVGFVWNKLRVNPGFYTMSQCELCLIGKRGKIPQPRGARNVRQLVEALRGRHSAKPSEVRERIERMFPEIPRIELFARETAKGWSAWGNEV